MEEPEVAAALDDESALVDAARELSEEDQVELLDDVAVEEHGHGCPEIIIQIKTLYVNYLMYVPAP